MANPLAPSKSLPPRYVEYTSADPAGFNLVNVTSNPPFAVVSNAPAVVGKSRDLENPSAYALPPPSTAMFDPSSTVVPPRYVEYANAEPVAFSLVMNMSPSPRCTRLNAPAVVGKSIEFVSPTT